MTTEDQDAQAGRLLRERRDLRAHHEALIAKAQALNRLLSSTGKALYHPPASNLQRPPTLIFESEEMVRVSDEYHPHQIVTGRWPSAKDLQELISEMKTVGDRLKELDGQLKAFGA